jgi:hypothetical protein
LLVIQRQLGHADLAITSVYLRGIDNTEIVDAVDSARHRRPWISGAWSPLHSPRTSAVSEAKAIPVLNSGCARGRRDEQHDPRRNMKAEPLGRVSPETVGPRCQVAR